MQQQVYNKKNKGTNAIYLHFCQVTEFWVRIWYDVALALRVYRFRYWLRLFGEGNDQLFVIVM
ncbi:hypothetical protein Hanom_Chr11g01038371 [Helianthus anomalus]